MAGQGMEKSSKTARDYKARRLRLFVVVVIIVIAVLIAAGSLIRGCPLTPWDRDDRSSIIRYPYGSEQFSLFIKNSCDECGEGSDEEFYSWFEGLYARWRDDSVNAGAFPFGAFEKYDFRDFLKKSDIHFASISDETKRGEEQLRCAAGVHHLVKAVIPKFSLERGFEFVNVMKYGERQCFLQSVLIAGILQEMGLDAGVVMVYRNERGEESNNGHALVLLKLSDAFDVTVDASEKTPFACHRGLFCKTGTSYRYYNPIYEGPDRIITAYRTTSGVPVAPREVLSCDVPFLMSMFYFYRGEWAPGGLRNGKKSPEGLELAASYFSRAIKECGENPLPVYYAARVSEARGLKKQAQVYYRQAFSLYNHYGWVPKGLR
ncbi:MAG: hypothetical protein RDV48_14100 [Candidatus Eremiobacteraeota bacterium]|nr:hypothetical protein [Candidatus Eremiobacteraeota bacterium]